MSYTRFGLMILSSTVVMYVLMYLNTHAPEHVFYSETRVYMAIMMGGAMAIVMLGWMRGMYPSAAANAAILAGGAVVFGVALWLVRSQATVSGPSYMRAMIPHHSIAVMTSTRAQIRDARVGELAREIVAAQRREIARMRHLIARVTQDGTVAEVYRDPPAEAGTIRDALDSTPVSALHPAPLTSAEARRVVGGVGRCMFTFSRGADPVLWATAAGDLGAIKLNGVLVALDGAGDGRFATAGASVQVQPLGEGGGWRPDADLVFRLDRGPTVGYRGYWTCTA